MARRPNRPGLPVSCLYFQLAGELELCISHRLRLLQTCRNLSASPACGPLHREVNLIARPAHDLACKGDGAKRAGRGMRHVAESMRANLIAHGKTGFPFLPTPH